MGFTKFIDKTAAEWAAENPILDAGDFGREFDLNGDTQDGSMKVKVGDGVTHWNDLEWFVDPNQDEAEDARLDDLEELTEAHGTRLTDLETTVNGTLAQQTLTVDELPEVDETIVIADVEFSFVETSASENEIEIAETVNAMAAAISTAINDHTVAGERVGTSSAGAVVTVISDDLGAAGNWALETSSAGNVVSSGNLFAQDPLPTARLRTINVTDDITIDDSNYQKYMGRLLIASNDPEIEFDVSLTGIEGGGFNCQIVNDEGGNVTVAGVGISILNVDGDDAVAVNGWARVFINATGVYFSGDTTTIV